MAASLSQEAKNVGLVAIRADKDALMKLVDNPNNKISPEKVELG